MDVLGSILDPLTLSVCQASEAGSAATIVDQINLEVNALQTCLTDLMNTVSG